MARSDWFNLRGELTAKEFAQAFLISFIAPILYYLFGSKIGGMSFSAFSAFGGASTATMTATAFGFFIAMLITVLGVKMLFKQKKPTMKDGLAAFGRAGIYAFAVPLLAPLMNVSAVNYVVILVIGIVVLVISEFTIDVGIEKLKI